MRAPYVRRSVACGLAIARRRRRRAVVDGLSRAAAQAQAAPTAPDHVASANGRYLFVRLAGRAACTRARLTYAIRRRGPATFTAAASATYRLQSPFRSRGVPGHDIFPRLAGSARAGVKRRRNVKAGPSPELPAASHSGRTSGRREGMASVIEALGPACRSKVTTSTPYRGAGFESNALRKRSRKALIGHTGAFGLGSNPDCQPHPVIRFMYRRVAGDD